MAESIEPLMLVPEEYVPSFEAMENRVPSSTTVIFPDETSAYKDSAFSRYDVIKSESYDNPTLHRLMRGVTALWGQTRLSQAEGTISEEEAERMFSTANLQETLIHGVGAALAGMGRRGVSLLDATYEVDGHINRRDQKMHDRYSETIAADARLYYALKNGGELPLDVPIEEMILDYDEELSSLASNIKAHRLAMERLRFEWLTSSVIVSTVREDMFSMFTTK